VRWDEDGAVFSKKGICVQKCRNKQSERVAFFEYSFRSVLMEGGLSVELRDRRHGSHSVVQLADAL